MENSEIIRFPLRFTLEDYSHCSNCIYLVDYLLSPDTDGDSLHVSSDDIKYLARLLLQEYNIMSEVIEASGGPEHVI